MKINWDNFVESYLILSRTVALIFRIDIVRYLSVHSAGLFVAVWCNIYNFIRHIGMQPQKYLTIIKKNKPTNRSTFHTFADIGLHQTDIYMNSLQRPFRFFAEYFCIKLCRLLSATYLTDWQLNNCTQSTIVMWFYAKYFTKTTTNSKIQCQHHWSHQRSNFTSSPVRTEMGDRSASITQLYFTTKW